VDFNRSFSPFMQLIKKHVAMRTNPLMISYEMNVGMLPRDHWIQSPQNGGRIIGEACHIFELFCFLTDSLPASVHVQTPFIDNNSFACTDNVIATVKMKDGSCCNLLYTAMGNGIAGKEHIKIHVDGKTIVMHDYVSLEGHGFSKSFSQKVRTQDKGHEALLKLFFASTQDTDFIVPVPFERIIAATRLSLIVDQLARRGGGISNAF
ncbi:MAG: oxidoreductase, partial [Pseudomonadota bacterium]